MPQSNSFWEHPIEKLEEALSIKKQIAALQAKLGGLFSGDEPKALAKVAAKPGRGGRRTMSPEARARIAAAQRARWAKSKGESSPAAASSPKAAKKRTISPEARAKMAAAAKRRWAAKKA